MKKICVGAEEVPVRATGFTTVLFKRFTGNDLMSSITDKTKSTEKINDVLSLFYCMNVQATENRIGDMFNKVADINDYYEFLNRFDSKDLYSETTMMAIVSTWIESSSPTSEAKNG